MRPAGHGARVSAAIAKRTADDFRQFCRSYTQYRKNGRLKDLKRSFEILAGMTDKLGRAAREVKHMERLEPRPDALITLRDSLAGLIIYSVLLSDVYNVSLAAGIEAELAKARSQHTKPSWNTKG